MQIAPSRNITINYIDSIAISIENNIILLADNTQVTADEIIVAIGLADSYKNSRNILSVWSNEAVKFHTNPNSCNANSIAIVGSNLSAVDVLVNLHFSAYNGDISVISSSGTFPLVHEPVPNITLDISPQDGRFGLHYVAKIIAEQQQQYSLTDAQIATLMRNIWPQIWQYFSSADKELFFSPRYFTKWYKARHRMPPQNAVIVQNMLSSKRINVIKDSVESIVQNANNATINCINMLQDFDLVIDTRHSHKSNTLLQNMLQNSLIVPDIVGYKTNQNHIYLLGSLTTAAHLECTSVPDLHKYARNTADNIMAKINKVYY
jgi:uncharacterized NAD(P)/FAD-binding protein YdhS